VSLSLAAIRDALDGGAPAIIATAAEDGTPNVSFLSDVQYLDERHLALSYQFFNKTRANILANPIARLLIIHGRSAQRYRVLVQYQRTATEGPIFEAMRARLAGTASHQGMAKVFRLLGADIYRVLAIDAVPCAQLNLPRQPSPLASLRQAMAALSRASDMGGLIDAALDAVVTAFAIPHALLLVRDAGAARLVTVASRGYAVSGVGAEVLEGDGVIGVAAMVGAPIRINHALADHAYVRALREQAQEGGWADALETPIPLPGLAAPGSQLALPVGDAGSTLAVLYVEHPEAERFGYDLEDALAVLAEGLGLAMRRLDLQAPEATQPGQPATQGDAPAQSRKRLLRLDARTNSVFVDNDYLIRGVAGAVLWKMLCAYEQEGRSEFSSRELRSDEGLGLPEICDNLAARLILLQRRLEERDCGIRLLRCGRGRIRLLLDCALQLDAGRPAANPAPLLNEC
jgi:adenylate cyclase